MTDKTIEISRSPSPELKVLLVGRKLESPIRNLSGYRLEPDQESAQEIIQPDQTILLEESGGTEVLDPILIQEDVDEIQISVKKLKDVDDIFKKYATSLNQKTMDLQLSRGSPNVQDGFEFSSSVDLEESREDFNDAQVENYRMFQTDSLTEESNINIDSTRSDSYYIGSSTKSDMSYTDSSKSYSKSPSSTKSDSNYTGRETSNSNTDSSITKPHSNDVEEQNTSRIMEFSISSESIEDDPSLEIGQALIVRPLKLEVASNKLNLKNKLKQQRKPTDKTQKMIYPFYSLVKNEAEYKPNRNIDK